jgi:predicted TIM-barrel fold metal-dependent hydrolase
MKLCVVLVAAVAASAADRPPLAGRIDAHAHIFQTSPSYFDLLERLDMRIVNICVVDKHDPGFEEAEPQHKWALEVFRKSHGRAPWCSTFDPTGFEKPGFAERSIAVLEKTFRDGAVAVKIYKDMGLELRTSSGRWVMPDDPAFRPILDVIEEEGRTVFAHIAEPSSSWRPLDPANPDYSYYKENPDWHMFLHPERPKKETILAARDHLLALHPGLRVVGCHLGSMEEDVDEIARHFDRYPRFTVDTAGRIAYLALQPRDKVRAFLIKYQDRVLYGTDLELMPKQDAKQKVRTMEATYALDWKFFASDERFVYEGRPVQGLALPDAVLRKIFRENAEHQVPLITSVRAEPAAQSNPPRARSGM